MVLLGGLKLILSAKLSKSKPFGIEVLEASAASSFIQIVCKESLILGRGPNERVLSFRIYWYRSFTNQILLQLKCLVKVRNNRQSFCRNVFTLELAFFSPCRKLCLVKLMQKCTLEFLVRMKSLLSSYLTVIS